MVYGKCNFLWSNKKIKKKTFVILIIIYIVLEVLIIINLPRIPLVKSSKDVKKKYGLEVNDPAYNIWYNAFGFPIFIHPKKAHEHFEVDYKEAVKFIEDKGVKLFDYSYNTLDTYYRLAWQMNFHDKTLPSEYRWIEKKAGSVPLYAQVCLNSMWEYVAEAPMLSEIIVFVSIVIGINCVFVVIFVKCYKEFVVK